MMRRWLLVVAATGIALQSSCTWIQIVGTPPELSDVVDTAAMSDLLQRIHGAGVNGSAVLLLTEGPRETTHVWPLSSTLPDAVAEELVREVGALPFGNSGKPPRGVGLEVMLGDSAYAQTRLVKRTPPSWRNEPQVRSELAQIANHIPEFTSMRVWLHVRPNGLVSQSHVERSTGSPFFDPRVEDIVSRLRFTPCKAEGAPVGCWVRFPVHINVPLPAEDR